MYPGYGLFDEDGKSVDFISQSSTDGGGLLRVGEYLLVEQSIDVRDIDGFASNSHVLNGALSFLMRVVGRALTCRFYDVRMYLDVEGAAFTFFYVLSIRVLRYFFSAVFSVFRLVDL